MAETLPDQEMCDEQLCRLAASGDRWAEGVLISRYLGMVRRFAAGRRGAGWKSDRSRRRVWGKDSSEKRQIWKSILQNVRESCMIGTTCHLEGRQY